MDEVKDILQHYLAGTIDFKGQATAEKYLDTITRGGVVLSVLVGIIAQSFEYMAIGFGATYVASLIFCLPIPAYRRNPVKFLEPTRGKVENGSKVEVKY